MLQVALVGFGLSGRYLQAPFFLANPNFNLRSIVSGSQNPQKIYPTVSHAHTIDEVLSDTTIDLLSIASPSHLHFTQAKQALMAGKHVLVEKPFTATANEAEELIKLAKQRGKILSVFQNRRFDGDFMTVKKIIENNFLGELTSFDIYYNRYKPILNTKQWKEEATQANGILYDLGAHIIDQTLLLFGSPKSIAGETYIQRQGSTIDDAFDIRLDYGSLKVNLKSSLLVREEGPRYVIHGKKGSFVKHGIDVQEDHLKEGLLPGMVGFGREPAEQWGILNTEIGGQHFRGHIETEVGNWNLLLQNIHEVIVEGKELYIKPEQVLEQIKIIEAVKNTRQNQ